MVRDLQGHKKKKEEKMREEPGEDGGEKERRLKLGEEKRNRQKDNAQ